MRNALPAWLKLLGASHNLILAKTNMLCRSICRRNHIVVLSVVIAIGFGYLVLTRQNQFEEYLSKWTILIEKISKNPKTQILDTQHITKSVVVQYGGRDEYISKS